MGSRRHWPSVTRIGVRATSPPSDSSPGFREEGAFCGRTAPALPRDLEPSLHRFGALEQCRDFVELTRGERAHRCGHPFAIIDALDELRYLEEAEYRRLRNADEGELSDQRLDLAELADLALGLWEQSDRLEIADR